MITFYHYFRRNIPFFFSLIALPFFSLAQTTQNKANHSFSISFVKSASQQPITGRIFLAISRNEDAEPQQEAGSYFTNVPNRNVEIKK
jgi:hypothetical protein